MAESLPAEQRAREIAEASPPTDVSALLNKALETGISVEALEKLVTLHERVADRQARQEFATALATFQDECPPIAQNRTAEIATRNGPSYSYAFADLGQIAKVVRPLLRPLGLSYAWTSTEEGGKQTVTCTLRHVNGHSESADFTAPAGSRAAMSDAQKAASAVTYARRQSLVMVLGLTIDTDTDGGDPEDAEMITEQQAADLELAVENAGGDKDAFLHWLRVESFDKIPESKRKMALTFIERKRKASQ